MSGRYPAHFSEPGRLNRQVPASGVADTATRADLSVEGAAPEARGTADLPSSLLLLRRSQAMSCMLFTLVSRLQLLYHRLIITRDHLKEGPCDLQRFSS